MTGGTDYPVPFTPPKLFEDAASPHEELVWAERTFGDGGDDPGTTPDTISGRLITAQAPQWRQAIALTEALAGRLETPAAVMVRAIVASGTPLSLLAYEGFERFGEFVPAFRRLNELGSYVAGAPPNEYRFAAADDAAALEHARNWYWEQRKQEILRARERALALRKHLVKVEQRMLVVEVWEEALRAYGMLFNSNSVMVVWENGAHDLYRVEARNWAYGLEVSPPVAVAYYLLALRDRGEKPAPIPPHTAAELLTPGWKKCEGAHLFEWRDEKKGNFGHVTADGIIMLQDTRRMGQVTIRDGVVTLWGKPKRAGGPLTNLASSRISTGQESLGVSWAVYRALERIREKEREERRKQERPAARRGPD